MQKKTRQQTLRIEKYIKELQDKTSLLSSKVLAAPLGQQPLYAAFLSLCDGKERAYVFHSASTNIASAWQETVKKAERHIHQNATRPLWVKADVITQIVPIYSELIEKLLSEHRPYFMRWGMAFDEKLQTALLESELNCNQIIDYENKKLNFIILNRYLKRGSALQLKALPDKIHLFRTQGFICDEENFVSDLHSDDLNFGRRIAEVDKAVVEKLLHTGSDFLASSVQEDGQFIYGYFPCFNRKIGTYNILRHISSLWTLINQYSLSPDPILADKIDRSLAYALANGLEDMNEQTSFIVDKISNEIKLGAGGVCIVVLILYMELFKTDRYMWTIQKLGNGILHMQNLSSNKAYFHILNWPDFAPKEESRIVYYDGEATFALCRLYHATKDQKWLDAASKSIDYFIENRYEKFIDHWIAYTMNEYTKYNKEEKYLAFALRNVQINMKRIHDQPTTYHTYMEMLMATFLLYDRIKKEGTPCGYLADFDENAFISTILKRADFMLNGYLYPEYAMYLASPETILGAFCVRHHHFRVRIDDVEHFLGGYYLYYKEFENIERYKKEAI